MKSLNNILVSIFFVIILCLIIATVLEKFYGSDFVSENVYSSTWMIILWALLVSDGCALIVKCKLWRKPSVLSIHIAFIVILLGAFLTHYCSFSGIMVLRKGETSNIIINKDNTTRYLPFNVRLDKFSVKYYEGTDTPLDYVSNISFLSPNNTSIEKNVVHMNKVASYNNYRFFQTSYTPDMSESVFTVSYDPYGMTVTYIGYGLLALSMLLFFINKNTRFRNAIGKIKTLLVVLAFFPISLFADNLKSTTPEVADEFGRLIVLYQGRVCPVNTLAVDFCRKLYKSNSYKGYSANQVLCGWMFYPMEWREEISIDAKSTKDDQKILLIRSLIDGNLLKIFPVKLDEKSPVTWVGRSGSLPESFGVDEWIFIRKVQSYLQQLVMCQQNTEAVKLIKQIKKYQYKKAERFIPSKFRQNIEIIYNQLTHTRFVAILCLSVGMLFMIVTIVFIARNRKIYNWFAVFQRFFVFFVLLYLLALFSMRWIALNSVPLTSGYEAMEFMALLVSALVLFGSRYFSLILPTGIIVIGFSLLVALLGESDPPITPAMPVLTSPLLSIHVMVIMLAYALMAIMFIVSLCAIVIMFYNKKLSIIKDFNNDVRIEKLTILNQVLLTPAVFLLTLGIFIGAVWANVSWGNYWQWDPKETWALITLLVYCLPLHKFMNFNGKPVLFNLYLLISFLCVLVTYFGVNYFLGGMHSYA